MLCTAVCVCVSVFKAMIECSAARIYRSLAIIIEVCARCCVPVAIHWQRNVPPNSILQLRNCLKLRIERDFLANSAESERENDKENSKIWQWNKYTISSDLYLHKKRNLYSIILYRISKSICVNFAHVYTQMSVCMQCRQRVSIKFAFYLRIWRTNDEKKKCRWEILHKRKSSAFARIVPKYRCV